MSSPLAFGLLHQRPPTAQVAEVTAQNPRPVANAGAAGSGVLAARQWRRAVYMAGADHRACPSTTPTACGRCRSRKSHLSGFAR
jgi:hypothetical protein